MPITEATAPPAKRTAAKSGAAAPTRAPYNPKVTEYEAGLKSLVGIGVLATTFMRQPADAITIAEYADDQMVNALALNATRNPYFGKALDMLSGTGGPMLELVALVMPLGLQFLANHKVIPANPQMGINPPEVQMAKAAQAAAKAQREAQAAMDDAMAQLQSKAA